MSAVRCILSYLFPLIQSLSLHGGHKINISCGWDKKKIGVWRDPFCTVRRKKWHCMQLLTVFPKNSSILQVPCFVKNPLKVPSSNLIFLKALAAILLGFPGSTDAFTKHCHANMLRVLPYKSMLIWLYKSVISFRSCSLVFYSRQIAVLTTVF